MVTILCKMTIPGSCASCLACCLLTLVLSSSNLFSNLDMNNWRIYSAWERIYMYHRHVRRCMVTTAAYSISAMPSYAATYSGTVFCQTFVLQNLFLAFRSPLKAHLNAFVDALLPLVAPLSARIHFLTFDRTHHKILVAQRF